MLALTRCSSIAMAAFLLLLNPDDLRAQRADLTVNIAQVGGQGAVATGWKVDFVVRVSNGVGQAIPGNVLVQVTIPAEFTELSSTGTAFACSFQGSIGSCTTTGFNANQSKEIRIKTTAPRIIRGTSQLFTLIAVADPNNNIAETENANNSDNHTVRVERRADLDVNLVESPALLTTQVAPNLVYVVTVKNKGDGAASNVRVESTLPKDVAFVGVEENQLGICLQNSTASDGSLQINCTLSSLAAGVSRHVRIKGKILGTILDGQQVTFAAEADPNKTVTERNETNNTAFMITTVRVPSELQLTFDGAIVAGTQNPSLDADCGAGSRNTIEVSLTVKNNGPNPSSPTIITAQWPARIVPPNTAISGVPAGACFDRCDVPGLNSGQSTVVKLFGGAFDANILGAGRATFTVDPAGTLFDAVVGNNSVTGTVCTGH